MNTQEASPELVKSLAELYYNAKDMSTTRPEHLAQQFCVTAKHVTRALRILVNRGLLLKIVGENNGARTWVLNPEYAGTLADAIKGSKGAFSSGPTKEYPKDFKIAGPAYRPETSKDDWTQQYSQQLNSFRKAAELSRK